MKQAGSESSSSSTLSAARKQEFWGLDMALMRSPLWLWNSRMKGNVLLLVSRKTLGYPCWNSSIPASATLIFFMQIESSPTNRDFYSNCCWIITTSEKKVMTPLFTRQSTDTVHVSLQAPCLFVAACLFITLVTSNTQRISHTPQAGIHLHRCILPGWELHPAHQKVEPAVCSASLKN